MRRTLVRLSYPLTAALFAALAFMVPLRAAGLEADTRAGSLIDADHFELRFQHAGSTADWEARKQEISRKFKLYSGMWPPMERCELNASIFDEKRGEGFRVYKAYFESLPGYLVTGNLYMPAGGEGPFPAVVCPHGHWTYGRLTNTELGSLPGRCIDLARMGFVVFNYDMVGYNDNLQLPHDPNKSRRQLKADEPVPYEENLFRGDFDYPRAGLYGLSLAGLHVWNANRAVDFLVSLPEVDSTRIAATGASGGASQTLFLMATDPRVKVAAPVNIISAAKHPGCRCENAPGSWVDISTMEITASFVPRPLILISATEDPWTNSFPTREMPVIQRYYDMYGASGNVRNVHVEGPHNYNADSRAAVYEFFAEHLSPDGEPIKDPQSPHPDIAGLGDLRVFPDHMLPDHVKKGQEVIRDWMAESEKVFEMNLPRNPGEVESFAGHFGPALRDILQVEVPAGSELISRREDGKKTGGLEYGEVMIGREGRGDCVGLEVVRGDDVSRGTLLLVRPESHGRALTPDGEVDRAVRSLVGKGYRVVLVGGYASGELAISLEKWDSFSWPEAYNRSNEMLAVQDIVTALCHAEKTWPGERITLAGVGECGLTAALAGAVQGGAGMVLADLDGANPVYDNELLARLPVAGIKRVGDFRTAAVLLMRKPLRLVNTSPDFDRAWFEQLAGRLGLGGNLTVEPGKTAAEALVEL